jgi:transcriptional regulator with XRE-family HTH domain
MGKKRKKPAQEAPTAEGPDLVAELKEAIRKSGQSLNELGQRSGVSSGQLVRFMNGRRTLTLPVASKIARALRLHLVQEEGETETGAEEE